MNDALQIQKAMCQNVIDVLLDERAETEDIEKEVHLDAAMHKLERAMLDIDDAIVCDGGYNFDEDIQNLRGVRRLA